MKGDACMTSERKRCLNSCSLTLEFAVVDVHILVFVFSGLLLDCLVGDPERRRQEIVPPLELLHAELARQVVEEVWLRVH